MSDRCRICKRVHYGFLDVCGPCIAENEGLVQHSPKKVVVPLKQSIPETKKSLKQTKNETNNSLKQTKNETNKRGRPREGRTICRSCEEPLAKGSNSYCRLHERERLKVWRLKQKK